MRLHCRAYRPSGGEFVSRGCYNFEASHRLRVVSGEVLDDPARSPATSGYPQGADGIFCSAEVGSSVPRAVLGRPVGEQLVLTQRQLKPITASLPVAIDNRVSAIEPLCEPGLPHQRS